MRIGINTLSIIPGRMGGMETYARGLVSGLREVDDRNEYVILANRENAGTWGDWGADFEVHECPVRGSGKAVRTVYEQARLNRAARRQGIELLHSLVHVAPPTVAGRATVVTIPDVIFRRFRREFTPVQRVVAGVLTRRAARLCDRVVTFSEFSRRDIAAEFGVPAGKIAVTPLACLPARADARAADAFFAESRIPDTYVFSVLATYHHKNLKGLLRAFSTLRQRHRIPHRLVIAGLPMAGHAEFVAALKDLGLHDSVLFLGWVPDAILPELYRRAACFVFPSLYEGFGLPVLEAMALGVPVACSNATSLPEVAGDAALLVDPTDSAAMAEAMWRCLDDADLRRSLVAKGKARAATLTWERCARETVEVYRELGAD